MNLINGLKSRYSHVAAVSTFVVCAVAILTACSTKHNTALSRGYQRLSSHYNVYYNGCEAFDQGIDNCRRAFRNDYSHVLPVFEFSNEQAARSAQGDMETALKKAHKLVQLHSITVKPNYSGTLTDEQRRFRAKEEFNPYVAEGYLLMGKANVVIHSEQEAIEQFDYISRKHEGERASYESKIWKSIAYAQLGQYNSAIAALKTYDLDGIAPSALYADYQAAYANIYILQKEYDKAIPYMERAVTEVKDSHCRNRYAYILAQLYRETGQKEKAAPIFLKLSRLMGDYGMSFAAKLDLPSVASTPEEVLQAEKKLNRMAKDPKNADQLDQVYYALGQLDLGRGNKSGAVDDFNKSVQLSVTNDNQKGLSFLSLADIYQSEPQYIEASQSLDSAAVYLDDANERKEEAARRAKTLQPLADQLRTIRDNDSLLRIAKLPSKERDALLDKIVKEHNDAVEAARRAKEADEENGMSQSDFYQLSESSRTSGQSSWYFYNTQLVAAGKATFRTRWGNRKNEDNWRRSDKSSAAMADLADSEQTDDEQAKLDEAREEIATSESDKLWTREQLIKDLPISDEAQRANEAQTADAMLAGASILYDDIHDYQSAAQLLDEYRRRFGNSDKLYDALTLLHFAQGKIGDNAGQAETDRQISSKFPESLMAKNIANPSFLNQIHSARSAANDEYKAVYDTYIARDYPSVISKSSVALSSQPKDAELRPHYLLLRAMAQAKSGNAEPFRADLQQIHADYAGTPQDSLAVLLLAKLDEGRMPVSQADYRSPLEQRNLASAEAEVVKKADYVYEPDSAHVIVCLVGDGKLKEAQFVVSDYNFSNFLIQDYDVAMRNLPLESQAIIISPFTNRKEAETYFYAIREKTFWRGLTDSLTPQIFMMSVSNLRLFVLSGPDDAFMSFMSENYIK